MREQIPQKRRTVRDVLNSILMVFIVILFIVAAFCGGCFFGSNYDISQLFEKQVITPIEKDDSKEEELNMNDPRIANLIPNLVRGVDCWAIEEFANDRKVVANDISNQRAANIAEVNNFYFSGKERILLEDFTKEIQKYLGKVYQFNPELLSYISDLCPQYQYLKETRDFLLKPNDCRITCGENTTVYKVIKGEIKEDILTLKVRVLFGSREGTNFYGDYGKTKFITDNPKELVSAISQGGEYLFTFKLENSNYVFVSSEPLTK